MQLVLVLCSDPYLVFLLLLISCVVIHILIMYEIVVFFYCLLFFPKFGRNPQIIATMNCIDNDTLIDILGRLPLKSLIRCKRVCRAWHALVSGEPLRQKLALVTSALLLCREDRLNEERRCYASTSVDASGGRRCGLVEYADLSFVPSHRKLTILDSCNGLVLCRNTDLPSGPFHVVNPLTRTWSALAEHPRDRHRVLLPALVFDPWRSPEFKVVTLSAWPPRGAELEVFSSETMAWTEHAVEWPPGITSDALTTTIRYFGGALHILARPNHIVCMDLAGMTCRRIDLPEPSTYAGSFLGKSRGHLYYYAHGLCEDQLRIWKLDQESSNELQWRLDCQISKKRVCSFLPRSKQRSNQFRFLGFHPGRKVVFLWLQEKLIAFDTRDESCEVLLARREEGGRVIEPIQIWVFPFTPSLVQLS